MICVVYLGDDYFCGWLFTGICQLCIQCIYVSKGVVVIFGLLLSVVMEQHSVLLRSLSLSLSGLLSVCV